MAKQQKVKVRLELGPDIPSQINPFQQPAAKAALLTAALRAMTVENLYPDAEFVGTKDGVTITLTMVKPRGGMDGILPGTIYFEIEGVATLETPEP
jgi:hypothetical protein